MKAKDIESGGLYRAEATYRSMSKVTVLEAPVVRQEKRTEWRKGERVSVPHPVRRDGKADGARVRLEENAHPYKAGHVLDITLTNVIEPWTDELEARRLERVAEAETRALFAEWASRYGLDVKPVSGHYGDDRQGPLVSVPREQLARVLRVLETQGAAHAMRNALLAANAANDGDRRALRESINADLMAVVLRAMTDDRQAAS